MKYPTIKKLPSGAYRMQIQIDGRRYSITESSPKLVKQKARELFTQSNHDKRTNMTVSDAIAKYIELREPFLSPSTVRGYKAVSKLYLQDLMNRPLDLLTQENITLAIVNDVKAGVARKTIVNTTGLISAMIKMFRPSFHPEFPLPPKEYNEIQIPTEAEMIRIWTEMYSGKYNPSLPISLLLASWLGLRMSEILGLRFEDFSDDHVTVRTAIVRGVNGIVKKSPKSYAGYRRIKVPPEISAMVANMPRTNDREFIVTVDRSTINRNFNRLCRNLGIRQYRIHDLRHFSASEALSLQIPNKYQMKRMGHSSEDMLQTVYQHVMRDKEDGYADIMDNHMGKLYAQATNALAAAHAS